MLTTDQAIERLNAEYPKGVSIYYVDYRDDLEDSPEAIEELMKNWSHDSLTYNRETGEVIWNLAKDVFTIEEMNRIKESEGDEVWYAIRDWFYDNDKSNPLKDICNNTRPIPIRIPMYSNYDCINSMQIADLSYPDSYLADVIDTLEINPRDVYNLLIEDSRVSSQEPWPDIPERNPYISAKDVINELLDNYGDGLRTFVGLLDISDCVGKWIGKTITIPKWNKWGFFAPWVWSWSGIDAVLLRDMTIELVEIWAKKPSDVCWEVLNDIDKANWYNMSDVYWPTRSFYTNEIILHHNQII